MDASFDRALDAVLEYEGGYVNNPKDPGGPTNKGITLANFKAFVNPMGTTADLKKLTIAQAAVVYRRNYWDAVMGAALPAGVDLCVFDFAVNSGPDRAAKLLQKLAKVPQDGRIGPKTLAAVGKLDAAKLIASYCDARLAFLKGLDTFATFGKGWTARVKKVRTLALELAAEPANAPAVVIKHVETVQTVPVVPKGADKPGIGRWAAGVPFLGTAIVGFGNLDGLTKAIIAGVVLLSIVILFLRGEQIAARAKAILASFGG